MMQYLLEVSISTVVVYLLYALFFKQSTFFRLNRAYLLGGLIISFFIPMLTLPSFPSNENEPLSILSIERIQTIYVPGFFQADEVERSVVSKNEIITMIYVLGVIFFLIRFSFGIWRVLELKRRSQKDGSQANVYFQTSFPTFSFFNFIFACPGTDQMVIDHERVHIRQMHWVDVVLAEMAAIALWFNPVIIWYKRSIKVQHEYLADQGVISYRGDTSAYMNCLVSTAFATNRIPVSSQFASHSIKNRINMITKNKTPLLHLMLYFLVFPAIALLLVAFQDASVKNPKAPALKFTTGIQHVPDGAPIESGKLKITYGFGEKFNPVTNKMQNHTGMDFLADEGVNVLATGDGMVIDAKFDEIKGNYVVIQHSDRLITQYFHLKGFTVKPGVTISKGEVIGFVGNTGLSIRAHLHYEVLQDGKAVNPVDFLPKEFKEGC